MSSKAELTRVVGSGGKRVKGAGVIGALKCFKQKKVFSSVTTTRGRVSSVLGHANIYIVAVKWRFANARAEAAMASVNRVAGVNREIHLEIFDLGILVRGTPSQHPTWIWSWVFSIGQFWIFNLVIFNRYPFFIRYDVIALTTLSISVI